MLAYVTNRDTPPGEQAQTIYVTGLDGDAHIPITDNGFAPVWSSGDRIVFQRALGDDWELFQLDLDGGGIVQLTFNPAADVAPDWTP